MKNFLEYLNEAEESPKEHRPSRSSTTEQLNVQAQHSDPAVVMAALNHRFAYSETTRNAVKHPDPEVALAALRLPRGKTDLWTVRIAGEHPDPRVASEARKNPMFDPTLKLPTGKPIILDKPDTWFSSVR